MYDERFDDAHRPERVEGWKPGMNDIPHSGCLPLEGYLLEKSLPLEADETFSVNGRSWPTLE